MESTKSKTVSHRAPYDVSTVEIEASARLERRQLEMLLMHALKISGGDFAYVVSASGKGAYAEQFVQLDAAAVRTYSGACSASQDSLNSRRADPSTLTVMRYRKVVQGSVLAHGLPLFLARNEKPVKHFVQIPIENGAISTSVLLVANPGISTSGKLQGDILHRLTELVEVISKRQLRNQASIRRKRASSSSDESMFQLRRFKEELDHAVVTVNTMGVIRGINSSAEKLFGCETGRALGMSLDRYLSPKYFVSTLQQVESWNHGHSDETTFAMNHRTVSILAEDGLTKELNASAYYLRDDKEKCVSFVLREPQADIGPKDEFGGLNFRVNSLSLGVIRIDTEYLCEHVNDLWCQISGQSSSEAKGLGWVDAIHAEDLMSLWVELGNCAEQRRPYSGKIRLQRIDGSVRQVALGASSVPNESGRTNGFVIVFQDLTVDYLAQQHINYAAEHDALTGLSNRSAFLDSLQLRLNKHYLRSKTALLSVNIKGLKTINARVGQHAGDEVIRLVSKRIMACVGNDGVGARISGNEFSVILVHSVDPAEICGIAEKISRSVKKSFAVFGESLHVSASVGVAIADNNSDTSDQLLKQADVALSAARSSANSQWKVYSQKLEKKWMAKAKLNERLREAVANNEFTLDYQPQYSVEKDEIVSFEALLRWVPSDVPVPETSKLIQWLENSGLIKDVGNWVLTTACSQFTTWKDIGLLATGCTMSVNIAPAQLMDSHFPEQIATILKDCHMSSHQLNLGIAEASLDEDDVTAYRVVNDLKEMGVRLSLSAFGMGKSSINRINRLSIDALKIDRSFVMALDTHEPSHTIVMSVLALANSLDIDVVAEGIESSDTLGRLKAADCKLVQGDLISKAKSAAFLEPMLVRRNYKAEDMIELS